MNATDFLAAFLFVEIVLTEFKIPCGKNITVPTKTTPIIKTRALTPPDEIVAASFAKAIKNPPIIGPQSVPLPPISADKTK